jgi:hypothetical protein
MYSLTYGTPQKRLHRKKEKKKKVMSDVFTSSTGSIVCLELNFFFHEIEILLRPDQDQDKILDLIYHRLKPLAMYFSYGYITMAVEDFLWYIK